MAAQRPPNLLSVSPFLAPFDVSYTDASMHEGASPVSKVKCLSVTDVQSTDTWNINISGKTCQTLKAHDIITEKPVVVFLKTIL